MFIQKYYRLVTVFFLLLLPLHLSAKSPCYPVDNKFTQEKLDNLLQQLLPSHREWLTDSKDLEKAGEIVNYNDKRRINLSGINLQGLDLSRKNLSMANLTCANLQSTDLTASNLSHAWLDGANLQNGILFKTNLSHAYLYDVRLENANLERADLIKAEAFNVNLSGAILKDANLTNANLHNANLIGANLFYAILSDSDFSDANLSKSIFYPKVNAYPDLLTLVNTFHRRDELFKNVKYYDRFAASPALASLRAAYRKNGMRETERIITNLLQRQAQENNWESGNIWKQMGSILSYILFDLTSSYGLEPQRPLSLLLGSILLFAFFYWIGLRINSKNNYFEVVWESNILTSNGRRGIKKGGHGLDTYHPLRFKRHGENWYKQILLELKMIKISFYFSILSAFHIGWKQYNIGVWIKQLQAREFSLRVRRGWMRSLSGFQSLLSVYLMVIWILTQFGRPFG